MIAKPETFELLVQRHVGRSVMSVALPSLTLNVSRLTISLNDKLYILQIPRTNKKAVGH